MKYGSHGKSTGGYSHKGKGPYHNGMKRDMGRSRKTFEGKHKWSRRGSSMKGDPPSR